MSVDSLGRGVAARQVQLVPSLVMAMLIFVVTGIMLFAGFVSAFTIMRRAALLWPPPGQPKLPVTAAAAATAVLLASGVALVAAGRAFRRGARSAQGLMLAAVVLGAVFVAVQVRELLGLLAAGLTMTSSALGSFFHLMVGAHMLHAVVALGLLVWVWNGLRRGAAAAGVVSAAEIFWLFVVGIWPLLFWRIYL